MGGPWAPRPGRPIVGAAGGLQPAGAPGGCSQPAPRGGSQPPMGYRQQAPRGGILQEPWGCSQPAPRGCSQPAPPPAAVPALTGINAQKSPLPPLDNAPGACYIWSVTNCNDYRGCSMARAAAGTVARVDRIPPCDICREQGRQRPAQYDGKTVWGPWAYMCEAHWRRYGVGLGLGKGQRLVHSEEVQR